MILPAIPTETPEALLAGLRAAVPVRIVFTTSFGIEDQAITHVIREARLDIEIVTLDTGRLFPETYELWAETEAKYDLRIRSYHPDPAELGRMLANWGQNGFYNSKDARQACCHVRKVAPLARALAGAEAWVTGLRADQSQARGSVAPLEWDGERGLMKAAPLFAWSREDVAEFCRAHAVPINPLHARGFPSIGCQPCTRAIMPGEPERAGRWWWEDESARECGLHVAADGSFSPAAQQSRAA